MHLPSSPSRRLLALAAVAGAAALVPVAAFAAASIGAGASGAARASAPRCASAGLVVWLDTQHGAAAGSVYYKLELTNLSSHACTLFGYPGVSAVDLSGHRLGRAASRNHVRKPRVVTLVRGATATAILQIVDAGNFPRASCREVTAAGLRVYPPAQTAAKLIPFPFPACSRSGAAYLSVQAVR
jgi:hypothetical protein